MYREVRPLDPGSKLRLLIETTKGVRFITTSAIKAIKHLRSEWRRWIYTMIKTNKILKGGKMKRSVLGFTLIELVLWLAVASGFAAIALPAVQ